VPPVRRLLPAHCRTVAVAIGLLLCLPGHANAGSYEVTLCTQFGGAPASADRWELFSDAGAGLSRNECRDGIGGARRLDSELAPNTRVANGKYAGWSFSAPPDTTIGSYTLWRAIRPVSGMEGGKNWHHAYFLYHDARVPLDERFVADYCLDYVSPCRTRGDPAHPYSDANRMGRTGVDLKRLIAVMECAGSAPSCPPVASPGRFEIYSARLGLTDARAPVITGAPTGTLTETDEPLMGVRTLSFTSTDNGAGIAMTSVVVDGATLVQRRLAGTSARCAKPYTVTVPCPLSGTTTLALDTATLPNGPHAVQASVTDAAGNETRSDPVAITARNGSRPNGRGASRFVKLAAWLRSRTAKQRASAVVPYGSVRTAEGRLTDAEGKPIGGAVLDVVSNVDRPGARDKRAGTVTTRDDGRFSYRIARGPSRDLRFEYKAYTLDPAPVSSAKVSLGVRAGFRLKLSPPKVRNGQRVVFRGQLKGGPARKGTRVTIDVLVPDARRRVPIGNVRADAKGRFRFGYRFRRTLVKARYRFQARLASQPGYPYRGATSRRVSVLVRP
jgi:hypothetical protein